MEIGIDEIKIGERGSSPCRRCRLGAKSAFWFLKRRGTDE